MLFIYFCDAAADSPCDRFKKETLDDPQVRRKLQDYVCLRLPLDAKITVQGKPVVLLEHEAFREMLGKPGVAIVDYRASDAKLRGVGGQRVSDHRDALVHAGTDGGDSDSSAGHAHPADADLRRADPSRPSGQHRRRAASRAVGGGPRAIRSIRPTFACKGISSGTRVFAASSRGCRAAARRARCAPRVGAARTWSRRPSSASAAGGSRPATGAPCAPRSRFFGYDMKRGANGVWYATGIVDGDTAGVRQRAIGELQSRQRVRDCGCRALYTSPVSLS